MKNILLLGLICTLFSCQPKVDDYSKELQNQINKLKSELSETYKPGFGEFMGNIQVHHSKLWFAGENENWKLAEFEINEIEENLEAIQKYETNRPESQMIPMIRPALDSVSNAIQKKTYYNLNVVSIFLPIPVLIVTEQQNTSLYKYKYLICRFLVIKNSK